MDSGSEPRLRLTEKRDRKPVVHWFLSYAHKDETPKERFLELLRPQLGSSARYAFEPWTDAQIQVGEDWRAQVVNALEGAHLGVLLVSPSFLESRFIRDHELSAFMQGRHQAALGKRMIPVMLRETSQFADFRGVDRRQIFGHERPFAKHRNGDTFVKELVDSIHRVLEKYADVDLRPTRAKPLPKALAAALQGPGKDARFTQSSKRGVPIDRGAKGQVRELLGFGADQQMVLLPNSENQSLREAFGTWTPSEVTLDAAEAVAGVLCDPRVTVRRPGQPIECEVETRHLVAFGFETSQPIYRQIAGYNQIQKGRSEFLGYRKNPKPTPFELPWKSNLATKANGKRVGESYERKVGRVKKTRRLWKLQRGAEVVRPTLENGTFATDYLSIVHVPSYLSQTPNCWLTLMAGIQSVGTGLLGPLMMNREILSRLQRDAPSGSGWQAIIRADVREPKRPRLSVLDVARVEVDWDILETWRRSPPEF